MSLVEPGGSSEASSEKDTQSSHPKGKRSLPQLPRKGRQEGTPGAGAQGEATRDTPRSIYATDRDGSRDPKCKDCSEMRQIILKHCNFLKRKPEIVQVSSKHQIYASMHTVSGDDDLQMIKTCRNMELGLPLA